jgi:hypothetical protein
MTAKGVTRKRMVDPMLDRRAFLHEVTCAGGALMVAAVLPRLSVASSAPEGPSTTCVGSGPEALGSGHIDDACGHWPPYAHPIPYAQISGTPLNIALVQPVDRNFML